MDPLEKKNIASDQPELAEALRHEMEEFLAKEKTQWEAAPEVELDEMRVNQLRALGYELGPVKKKESAEGEDPEADDAVAE